MEKTLMGRCRLAALGIAVALAGCASAPITAGDSAIALGKNLVLDSVPLGGLAVQALVSVGDGEDRGSYRYKSQLFCQTSSQALANIRQKFAILCGRKGGDFENQFCVSRDGVDRVLFSAQLEHQGVGSCYRLNVSEAITVGSPDYLQFLVSKAGYETADAKAARVASQRASTARVRARAEAEQQAYQAREMERLRVELPLMRKRGARVCRSESNGMEVVYRGYVECCR